MRREKLMAPRTAKMRIESITAELARLREKHGELKAEHLAASMGVLVRYEPMGMQENACKGFFLYHSRKRLITINSDLNEDGQRIVLAHELGHAVLHRTYSASFHDFSLFDDSGTLEYEANLFAAELLVDDEELLMVLEEGVDFFSAAKRLRVPAELLDFKLRILKSKGYEFQSPIHARSNFLKGDI